MIELAHLASQLRAGVLAGYAGFAILLAILPLGNRPKLFSRLFVFCLLDGPCRPSASHILPECPTAGPA
jgi:hypothetical protein